MFGLLAGPYGLLIKAGVILAGAVGLFSFGYYKGHMNAVSAQKAKIVTQVLVQTKYLPQEAKIIHDKQVVIQTVHDKVYVDVVKNIPDNRACDLPADSVGVLNTNRGALSPVQ